MTNIDVILICYNQEQYIESALESILLQRVKEDVAVRLIVADDCSPDQTLTKIHQYLEANNDGRLLTRGICFLESEHNLGISRNYQRAFAACDGDYIAIMEGDDYWSKDYHLQQHIDFLQSHRECSMSMNRITYTYDNGPETIDEWHFKEDFHNFTLQEQIEWSNLLGNLSACVLRTSCVKCIPEKNFSVYFDDFLLGISLAEFGNIGILKESTSVYRGNSNSLWASMNSFKRILQAFSHFRLYDNLYGYKYHTYWIKSRRRYVKQTFIDIRTYIAHKISGKS